MPGTTSARPVATAAEVCAVAKVTETVTAVIRGALQRPSRAAARARAVALPPDEALLEPLVADGHGDRTAQR